MPNKRTKKVLTIAVLVFTLVVLIFTATASLPYNKETHWSALYFDADLTDIYGTSLDELKNAYTHLSSLDYYEISNQYLEITYPSIKTECLYGYEYGNAETRTQNGSTIYPTKCFQISENCCSLFEITIAEGRTFCAEDMNYVTNKIIPVIAGHEFSSNLKIGDNLEGLYIQENLTCQVVGILKEGSNINLGGQKVCLDTYLLIPSFNMSLDPIDERDDLFQVRHYANKLSGKLHYNSIFDFLKYYKTISHINKNTLLTEGKIIF